VDAKLMDREKSFDELFDDVLKRLEGVN